MKSFSLTVLNPEKIVYQGDAVSLTVPAANGYLGVLADHAPMVAALKPGSISFRNLSGEETTLDYKGKGFLEVFHNQVSVLLSSSNF